MLYLKLKYKEILIQDNYHGKIIRFDFLYYYSARYNHKIKAHSILLIKNHLKVFFLILTFNYHKWNI